MNHKYNKILSLAFLALPNIAIAQNVTCTTATTVQTFNYSNSMQTFTVPTLSGETISNLHIEAYGAQGENASDAGGAKGLGGFAEADYTTPAAGTVLNIFVGGAGNLAIGGFNGGGNAGGSRGGAGGGASDIRVGGVAESNRIIVAGGGGGGGQGGCVNGTSTPNTLTGGAGGSANSGNGTAGTNSTAGFGGQGATGAVGGAAGIGCILASGTVGATASTGAGGAGGAGSSCCCLNNPHGGGGGGGYLGGGGGGGGTAGTTMCSLNATGGGGGGAGGSSYVAPALANAGFSSGVQSGDGQIKICYSTTAFTPTPTPTMTPTMTPTFTPTNTPTFTPTNTPTLTPTPTNTPTLTPTNTPTLIPTPLPTALPTPSSKLVVVNPSVGSSTIPAPTLTVVKETVKELRVRMCYNYANYVTGTGNVFGIVKPTSSSRLTSRSQLSRKKPCMDFKLTRAGTYEAFFLQTRARRTSIQSNITQFRVN